LCECSNREDPENKKKDEQQNRLKDVRFEAVIEQNL